MTLQDFITKYNGKGIDYDSSYGFQCVDLYRQYVKEVLGFPQSKPIPGAKDVWDTYLSEYYTRIANTPTGVPQRGDIMIWGSTYGKYGHIAVVTEATVKNFKCFSQNDPVGTLCKEISYTSYKGVLGWLRPKAQAIPQPNPDALEACLKDHVMLVDKIEKELKPTIIDLETERDDLKRQNNTYKDQQIALSKQLDCENQFPAITGKIEGLLKKEDDLVDVQDQNLDLQETITDNYIEEVKTTVFPPTIPKEPTPTASPPGKSFLGAILDFIFRRK